VLRAGLDNQGGKLFARANQTAHEGIMALRTVHSYNMQEKVARIYRSMLEGPNKKALSNALKSGLSFGASQAIMFLFYALAFWFGGTEVRKGRMNLEQMLKVFFAILLASMGMSQAQLAFPDVAKGKSAVKRIFRGVFHSTIKNICMHSCLSTHSIPITFVAIALLNSMQAARPHGNWLRLLHVPWCHN
jgi:ABC-type multidrug transport system fused ATPase/permease subunit